MSAKLPKTSKAKIKGHFLKHRLKAAHQFIHGLQIRSKDYGSAFSAEVTVDCENFMRDNPAPKESTHIVISRAYLDRLMDMAKDRLRLKIEVKRLSSVRADLAAKGEEADKLRTALVYVDRQVREVWKPESTYEHVHHAWAMEQATAALAAPGPLDQVGGRG